MEWKELRAANEKIKSLQEETSLMRERVRDHSHMEDHLREQIAALERKLSARDEELQEQLVRQSPKP